MSGTVRSLRHLAGDALVAGGLALLRGADRPEDNAHRGGAMECDGPRATWSDTAHILSFPEQLPIPAAEVRAAIDELEDSKLIRIAATIIAGWKPILLRASIADLTDVDVLIAALRDRADQFAAVERDANCPTPNTLEDLHGNVLRGFRR